MSDLSSVEPHGVRERQTDMRLKRVPVVVAAALALAATACTSGSGAGDDRSRDAAPSASAPSQSQRLCEAALPTPVAASSLTTVEDVRQHDVGGPAVPSPGPSDRPLRAAFGAAAGAEPAAWCTVGANGNYIFYAAGSDGTAVEAQTVSGWTGTAPDRPVPAP